MSVPLTSMKHGQVESHVVNGHEFKVSYHDRQSYGDRGQRVSGATEGEFTVEHPNGRMTTHPHGPHANTPLAAKRGANPGAKAYAAQDAVEAIRKTAATAGTFNDRRMT